MEAVPADRFTALQAQYPKQTSCSAQQRHLLLDERAASPVRQAGGAPGGQLRDRPHALVKIFGGQGVPPRRCCRRCSGTATTSPPLSARPRQGQAAGPAGRRRPAQAVQSGRRTPTRRPRRRSTWRSVLNQIGLKVTGVKTVDDSVYWDTLLTQSGDPQIAFNHFDQDYPEGEDFIDTLAERRAHRQRRQQRRLQHRRPDTERDDRPDQADAAGRGPKRAVGQDRQPTSCRTTPAGRRSCTWSRPTFVSAAPARPGLHRLLLRADP